MFIVFLIAKPATQLVCIIKIKKNTIVWNLLIQICLQIDCWTKITQENTKTNLDAEVLLPIGY